MATEKEKMIAERLYIASDAQLSAERTAARKLCDEYNRTTGDEQEKRYEILNRLFHGNMDMTKPAFIEPPLTVDYGYNVTMGPGCYMNFNCCFLDCAPIKIGKDVLMGPMVQLYPPAHPLDPAVRDGLRGPEYARGITIGDNVWIGGGAIILGGVTVGGGASIGAGSVVTKDVEPWTVVAGNPARLIRRIEQGYKSPHEKP
ncbi:g9485 [Coccomyxa elongata]